MKPVLVKKLEWREVKNGVHIDCSMDIAVHPAKNKIILLTIPGVDGSVDGYKKKYVRIAEDAQAAHGVAVVRMSNPYITSFHWESTIRRVMNFIKANAITICGHDDYELRIMAHSAGASVIAKIAWQFPHIKRLLLVNPAAKLGMDEIEHGLRTINHIPVTILVGDKDFSKADIDKLLQTDDLPNIRAVVVKNADHNFSGEALEIFIESPLLYLFD